MLKIFLCRLFTALEGNIRREENFGDRPTETQEKVEEAFEYHSSKINEAKRAVKKYIGELARDVM